MLLAILFVLGTFTRKLLRIQRTKSYFCCFYLSLFELLKLRIVLICPVTKRTNKSTLLFSNLSGLDRDFFGNWKPNVCNVLTRVFLLSDFLFRGKSGFTFRFSGQREFPQNNNIEEEMVYILLFDQKSHISVKYIFKVYLQ